MTQAIIFDFDGLTVDTEYAIYEAWRDLYRSQGQDLAISTYVQCVGSTFQSYDPQTELERLLGYTPDWERLTPERRRYIREAQADLDALPGVRDLLHAARAEGIRLAVASSSEAVHVHGWLDKLGLRASFDTVCTRDDVAHAKPAPDLFLLALERLGVAAEHAVVLEDSSNGLLAADAAKVACIVVPNRITCYSAFPTAAARLTTLEGCTPSSLLCHTRASQATTLLS